MDGCTLHLCSTAAGNGRSLESGCFYSRNETKLKETTVPKSELSTMIFQELEGVGGGVFHLISSPACKW